MTSQCNTETLHPEAAIPTDASLPAKAGAKEWLGLGLLALPTILLGLDLTLLHLALPALAADLQPTSTEALWIMDAYGFMIAGFLITMGTLGDRIGRRKLLMIGAAAFALASLFAAFSTSAIMLIAARAALGVAGATLMPSTMAAPPSGGAKPAMSSGSPSASCAALRVCGSAMSAPLPRACRKAATSRSGLLPDPSAWTRRGFSRDMLCPSPRSCAARAAHRAVFPAPGRSEAT